MPLYSCLDMCLIFEISSRSALASARHHLLGVTRHFGELQHNKPLDRLICDFKRNSGTVQKDLAVVVK
jgi:hypothetical protein